MISHDFAVTVGVEVMDLDVGFDAYLTRSHYVWEDGKVVWGVDKKGGTPAKLEVPSNYDVFDIRFNPMDGQTYGRGLTTVSRVDVNDGKIVVETIARTSNRDSAIDFLSPAGKGVYYVERTKSGSRQVRLAR